MTGNAMVTADQLWRSVRDEAESAFARDPLFGGTVKRAILDHADLGGAVAHQIGERLGKGVDDRAQFSRLAREGHRAAPDLVGAAVRDAAKLSGHHPPATSFLPPLLQLNGDVP